MAIKYVLVERPNPQDRTAPKKFYANAVVRGSMGLEGLAERIAGASTASKGDMPPLLYLRLYNNHIINYLNHILFFDIKLI